MDAVCSRRLSSVFQAVLKDEHHPLHQNIEVMLLYLAEVKDPQPAKQKIIPSPLCHNESGNIMQQLKGNDADAVNFFFEHTNGKQLQY